MKTFLVGLLALSSLSAFAVGGTVKVGGAHERDQCALSDGTFCYQDGEGGATACKTWTPPTCSNGLKTGTIKKAKINFAPRKSSF